MARWKALRLLAKMARVRVPKGLKPPSPLALVLFAKFTQGFSSSFVKRYKKSREEGDTETRSFNLYPVETQELFDSSMFEMPREEER